MTDFWRGRRVLVTGHTGFKGAWLCLWLDRLEAKVSALALPPATDPSLYRVAGPWSGQEHRIVDLRDASLTAAALETASPEIVFHLAAQSLVRAAYRDPLDTYATNLMGTLNLLDAVRRVPSVRVVIVVTTDKVYENLEAGRPFAEGDRIGGGDPYSNSKACVELAVAAFRAAFFAGRSSAAVACVRAGNVLGGGDWAEDRLVPDLVRAAEAKRTVRLRYPDSIRPWQHVLDPLHGYLMLAERLAAGAEGYPPALNFGPDAAATLSVAQLAERFDAAFGAGIGWERESGDHPEEAQTLVLDSGLAQRSLGWRPRLDTDAAIAWTADWYRHWRAGGSMRSFSLDQIARYEALGR